MAWAPSCLMAGSQCLIVTESKWSSRLCRYSSCLHQMVRNTSINVMQIHTLSDFRCNNEERISSGSNGVEICLSQYIDAMGEQTLQKIPDIHNQFLTIFSATCTYCPTNKFLESRTRSTSNMDFPIETGHCDKCLCKASGVRG